MSDLCSYGYAEVQRHERLARSDLFLQRLELGGLGRQRWQWFGYREIGFLAARSTQQSAPSHGNLGRSEVTKLARGQGVITGKCSDDFNFLQSMAAFGSQTVRWRDTSVPEEESSFRGVKNAPPAPSRRRRLIARCPGYFWNKLNRS